MSSVNSDSKPVWTLDLIAKWTGGQILSRHQLHFSEIGTDTRVSLDGKIFIALKGDQFDAHDYLDQAVIKNAGLLLVHKNSDHLKTLSEKVSVILVEDTLKALQNFAHEYRKSLSTKIIGITGSNGKTTTKEYTAAILGQYQKTHFNQGSFNNHWGVPLTLLQIPTDAQFAVIEMGMNHTGEITQLVKIADPDFVVCTMVGRAHIENFGTIQGIAKAKAEIYQDSRENTVRVFNQDQDLTFDMMYPVAKKFPASRMLSFSENNNEADVYFKVMQQNSKGLTLSGSIAGFKSEVTVPLFGRHNVTNLMAAACLSYACGMKAEDIWKALPLCKSTWGRNEFIETQLGVDVLFDGYNANPDSMQALLNNIPMIEVNGSRIGVFGQMKELGAHAQHEHFFLAEKVAQAGFDQVFFIGENHADFENGLKNQGFSNYFVASDLNESLGQNFLKSLKPQSLVVIKGSRGARTERFVELCEPLNWKTKS